MVRKPSEMAQKQWRPFHEVTFHSLVERRSLPDIKKLETDGLQIYLE